MSYTRTRLQLRKAVVSLASIAGADGDTASTDLTASVLNDFINDARQESYNIIVGKWEDYYTVQGADTSFVANQQGYDLPTDFYKLRLVELKRGSGYCRVYPLDLSAQHMYSQTTSDPTRYRIMARKLYFVPTPGNSTGMFRIFYIPTLADLTDDADVVTFDVPVEYKLLISIAWRDCLDRQELDPSPAIARIDALIAGLRTAADSRDATEPFYLSPNGPPAEYIDDDWWIA